MKIGKSTKQQIGKSNIIKAQELQQIHKQNNTSLHLINIKLPLITKNKEIMIVFFLLFVNKMLKEEKFGFNNIILNLQSIIIKNN